MTTQVPQPAPGNLLLFSDLDGTLLDHDSYSAAPALGLLARLERQGIPVIFCTSKTYAELIALRETLANPHPFIAENGAVVWVPDGYFPTGEPAGPPGSTLQRDGYRGYAFCAERGHWQALLAGLPPCFDGKFRSFSELGVDGISAHTGLSPAAAARAAQREFGEPVVWLGDERDRARFLQELRERGASVLQGGRFMHVSGACDKGQALLWLAERYRHGSGRPRTIAAGDSGNDRAMLEAADFALIVRSPAHAPPAIDRRDGLWISDQTGPAGWAEGIQAILASIGGVSRVD